MTEEHSPVNFAGAMDASGWSHTTGFRGRGTVAVDREGIEFRLNAPVGRLLHRHVKRADLAAVYPVRARPLSVTNLVAAVVPQLANAAVRFLTPPVGLFADRDVFMFWPRSGQQPLLLDVLDELGYPLDRTVRTYRLYWGDEA